jgi:hypothetical protein
MSLKKSEDLVNKKSAASLSRLVLNYRLGIILLWPCHYYRARNDKPGRTALVL